MGIKPFFFISGVPIIGRKGLKLDMLKKKFVKLSLFPKTTLGLSITQFGNFSLTTSSPKSFEFEYKDVIDFSIFKAER